MIATKLPLAGTLNIATANACERLALSRERLRVALLATSPCSARADKPGDTNNSRSAAADWGWLEPLRTWPVFAAVCDIGTDWWQRHPLRPASHAVMHTVSEVFKPLARRHPVALVLGAAGVGAVVVWLRPWRWLPVSAVLAGVLARAWPQVLSSTLARMPLEAWLAAFAAMATPNPASNAPTSSATPASSATAAPPA